MTTTTIEDRHYMQDDPPDQPLTTRCLRPIARLGYPTECGMPLADDADWDEVYCPGDLLQVDRDSSLHDEYSAIRDHWRESA